MEHVTTGSLAFWAWNDDLQEPVLLEQLRQLRDAGFTGFFMHSREGLETPYLSDRWMDLCDFCAEEGRKLGLEPYLYDEDKWPSGMAGGLVTRSHPQYAAKAIVYFAETDSFQVLPSQGHDWYSGNPPADNLSEGSVRAYLDITHEAYRKRFGDDFSSKIAGFFTDEPNCCDFFYNLGQENRPCLPFTDDFSEEFRRRRGYELNVRLLFFREGDYLRHRHDYWRTLSELFCERYTRQIHQWCREQGVRLCGHLLFENDLGYQTRVCGAVMPNYRHMDVPGIDILGQQTREYLTVKQCSSVAHQYGKEATISETYGCTGWDFTFAGQKQLWDFQCALGISIRSQHLSFYSIRGLRKRDYPPAFSYQSESFRYNRVIDDYCAGLSRLQQEGRPHRPVLVLHPISSIWCHSGSAPDEDLTLFDGNMGWLWPDLLALNRRGEKLNRLAEGLLKSGIDFDFGDEQLLEADGTVVDGQMQLAQARYSIVVLPEMESIFRSTWRLLEQFAAAGGKILVIGSLPTLLEGQEADLTLPGAVVVPDASQALERLGQWVEQPVRITDYATARRADVLSVLRDTEDGHLLTVVGDGTARTCCVAAPGYRIEAVDIPTGRTTPVAVDSAGRWYISMEQWDCRVYRLHRGCVVPAPVEPPYFHPHQSEKLITVLAPEVPFRRTMDNALTLDCCAYRMYDEPFSAVMQVFQAQREIRQRLGFRQIVGNGVEMRYLWVKESHPTAPVTLRFTFRADHLPATPVYAGVELADRMTLTCNGQPCTVTDGWFVDRDIRKVLLPALRTGENVLELTMDYDHAMELEDIYLIGDFAVNRQRAIVAEPTHLHLGDVTLQGYLHYPGSLRYCYTFTSDQDRGVLCLGDYRATLVVARIEGMEPVYLFHGQRAELPLHVGENRLELELVGSNRNLFGPFHHTYDGASRISWEDFRQETGDRYTPDYLVKPFGLLSPVKILAPEEIVR